MRERIPPPAGGEFVSEPLAAKAARAWRPDGAGVETARPGVSVMASAKRLQPSARRPGSRFHSAPRSSVAPASSQAATTGTSATPGLQAATIPKSSSPGSRTRADRRGYRSRMFGVPRTRPRKTARLSSAVGAREPAVSGAVADDLQRHSPPVGRRRSPGRCACTATSAGHDECIPPQAVSRS